MLVSGASRLVMRPYAMSNAVHILVQVDIGQLYPLKVISRSWRQKLGESCFRRHSAVLLTGIRAFESVPEVF